MKHHSTILVHEILGSSIQTREASSVLMNRVKNNSSDNIEFDFILVENISRSFADQFYFDKNKYANELKKNIVVSNASDNVIKMLQAVAKSQDSVNTKIHNVPVYKYTSYSQLESFLLSF
jgi:hypothetical protein